MKFCCFEVCPSPHSYCTILASQDTTSQDLVFCQGNSSFCTTANEPAKRRLKEALGIFSYGPAPSRLRFE